MVDPMLPALLGSPEVPLLRAEEEFLGDFIPLIFYFLGPEIIKG